MLVFSDERTSASSAEGLDSDPELVGDHGVLGYMYISHLLLFLARERFAV